MKKACEIPDVSGDWLHDHSAIVVNDEAHAIAGVEPEMIADRLRNRDLPFGCQGGVGHLSSLPFHHILL